MDTRTRWYIYRWTYRMFYLFGLIMLVTGMLLSMISSPAQASGPRTVQQTATSRPQFQKQPESHRSVQRKGGSEPAQPQLQAQGVGQQPPTLDPNLTAVPTLPPGTGSVRFLTPDTAVCMLGSGTLEATVEVSLPAGVSANLQTSYRIAEPIDLRTDAIYSYQTVEDGDQVTISGDWPGVRPGDAVVEVHFGAVLLDPATGSPISNGAGVDYYWYPWYCTAATPPPPTIVVGETETVTPTATETEFPTAVSPTEITITPTETETTTPTATVTTVPTSSATPTITELPPTVQVSTATFTPTVTATWTATVTATVTETSTSTPTQPPPTIQVETATFTPTVTATYTRTPTPTETELPPTVQAGTATLTPTVTNTPPPTLTVQGPTAVSPTEETVPTVGESQATATLERPTPIVIVVTATSEIPITGGQQATGQPTAVLGGESATEQVGPLQAPAANEESLIPVTGADLANQPLSAASLPFWQKLTTYMGLLMLGAGLIMQGLSKRH